MRATLFHGLSHALKFTVRTSVLFYGLDDEKESSRTE